MLTLIVCAFFCIYTLCINVNNIVCPGKICHVNINNKGTVLQHNVIFVSIGFIWNIINWITLTANISKAQMILGTLCLRKIFKIFPYLRLTNKNFMSSIRNSQGTTSTSDNVKESLLVWFLRFFTSVPWGLLPSTNLVNFADNCYTSLIFSCFPFFCFSSTWNLKNYFFLSSFCSLCFFLLHLVFLSNLLFFYFSFPITLFCLLLPYVLLLFNLFSFYYLSSFRVLYVIPIFMTSLGFIAPPLKF